MTRKAETAGIVAGLRENITALKAVAASGGLPGNEQKKLNLQIKALVSELEKLLREMDPTRHPSAVFDPSSPDLIGRFIALALVAQKRHPLDGLESFYGSGVYAIYYKGGFNPYLPISGKEVPVYVGKAEPGMAKARTPVEQGEKLSSRLNEHCKNIRKAESTLNAADFECRYLVVQSGWEAAAEKFLIDFFRPVWNNETNICYGIGKHGDSSKTRSNSRSPWDTLHPGRPWADDPALTDAFPKNEIISRLGVHFQKMHDHGLVYKDITAVLNAFLEGLRF